MDKCQGCGLDLTDELIAQGKCPLCGHDLKSDASKAPQPEHPVVAPPAETPVAPRATGPNDGNDNAGPLGTLDAGQFSSGEGVDSPFSYQEKNANDTALPNQTLDPSNFTSSSPTSDPKSTIQESPKATHTDDGDERSAIAPIELPPDESQPEKTRDSVGNTNQTIVQGDTHLEDGDSPNVDKTLVSAPADQDAKPGGKTEAPNDTVSYDAKNLPRDLRQVRSAASDSSVKQLWKTFNDSKVSPKMSIKVDNQVQRVKDGLAIHRRSVRTSEDPDAEEADYQLLRFIGEGGMGTVYEAKQGSVQRSVAVKTLKPELAKKRDNREKFLYEAHITGDLDHPNIVPIHELGASDDGTLFYSMKLVTGTPWEDVIRDKSRKENLEILMKVADAVSFAHSRQIIHRDLKPENIMLGQFGEVLVMDWGLAIHLKNKEVLTLGGTPAYMAPEMARHQISKIGIESDIYLLGAILYESIAGYPPHPGRTITECVSAAAQNQIIECDAHDDELFSIAMRAMDLEPSRRYSSVVSLQNAIRDYESHAESINLAARAKTDLDEAQESSDYNTYARALFGFRDAVELWPENLAASSGLVEARIAYATQAYNNRDYDLGLSLLDPRNADEAALVEKLKKGKGDQDARDRRFKVARTAAIGFLLTAFAVALGAYLYTQDLRRSEAQAAENLALQVKATEEANKELKIKTDDAIKAQAAAVKAKTEAEVAKTKAEKEKTKAEKLAVTLQETNTDLSDKTEKLKKKTDELKTKTDEAVAAKADAEKARDEAEKNAAIAIEKTLLAQGLLKNSIFGAFQAKLSLAYSQIEDANIERALTLLKEAKELDSQELELSGNLLNWAWYRLNLLCHDDVPTQVATSPIVKSSVSADGSLTAFATESGELFVYKTADLGLPNAKPLNQPWKTPANTTILDVAMAPNGQFVACCTNVPKATVVVWDRANGRYASLDAHAGESVNAVAVAPNSQILATGGIKGIVKLWSVAGGQVKSSPLTDLPEGRYLIRSLDFSSDGRQLAASASRGPRWRSNVWDIASKKMIGQFSHVRQLSNSIVLPGGQFVAAGQINGDLLVWETSQYPFRPFGSTAPAPTRTAFVEVKGLHEKGIRNLSLSPNSDRLLTSGADASLKIWTLPANVASVEQWNQVQPLQTIRGHVEEVVSADFASSDTIVSGSLDKSTRLWDLPNYREEIQLPAIENEVALTHTVQVSEDRVVAVDSNGVVHFLDTDKVASLGNLSIGHAENAEIRGLFDAKTNQVITSGNDGTTCVWDATTGLQKFRLTNTSQAPAIAITTGANSWLITAGDEFVPTQVWDLKNNLNLIAKIPVEKVWGARFGTATNNRTLELAVSHDDKYLVFASPAKQVAVWDLAQQKPYWTGKASSVNQLELADQIDDLTVAPTGDYVYAIGKSIVLRWPLQSNTGSGNEQTLPVPNELKVLSGGASGKSGIANSNLDFATSTSGQKLLLASWALKPQIVTNTNNKSQSVVVIWGDANSLEPSISRRVNFEVTDTTTLGAGKIGLLDNKGQVFVWDFEQNGEPRLAGQAFTTLAGENAKIQTRSIQMHDNRTLCVGPERAIMFNLQNGAAIPFGRVDSCTYAHFDTQHQSMVSTHADGSVWVWDMSKELAAQSPTPLSRQYGPHLSAQISPDGKRILSVSQKPNDTPRLIVWSRDQQKSQEVANNVTAAAWSPEGNTIAVAKADNTLQLLDQESLEVVATPTKRLESKAVKIKVAPDSKYIATLMENGEVSVMFQSVSPLKEKGDTDPSSKVWNSYVVKVAPDRITDFAISPIAAGSQLVTADDNGSATVWQVSVDDDRPRELIVLRGHSNTKITSVEFSTNGHTIVTGDAKGHSMVWLSAGWTGAE